jgi:hypothetical protein
MPGDLPSGKGRLGLEPLPIHGLSEMLFRQIFWNLGSSLYLSLKPT